MYFIAKKISFSDIGLRMNVLIDNHGSFFEVTGIYPKLDDIILKKLKTDNVVIIDFGLEKEKYRFYLNPNNPTVNVVLVRYFPVDRETVRR